MKADGAGIYPGQELNQELTCYVPQISLAVACIWDLVTEIRNRKLPVRIKGVRGNQGRQYKYANAANNFDYIVLQILYMLAYAQNAKAIKPKFTEGSNSVTVDRTSWLKGTAQEFRDAKIRIPSAERVPLIPQYIKQMTCSVVMLEEDDDGNIVERVEETCDDHFFHASGYGLMGFQYFGGESDFDFDFV